MLVRAEGLNSQISRDFFFGNHLCRKQVPAFLLKGAEFYFSVEEMSNCSKLEKEIGQKCLWWR